MAFVNQHFTCPFCCTDFIAQEIRFRCMRSDCPGQGEDKRYNRASVRHPLRMGRILIPTNQSSYAHGLPQSVQCDRCRTTSHTRICPSCHFELPSDFGQTTQLTLAIMGGPAVGKTHFLAALLKRLNHEIGPYLRINIQPLGEQSQIRWQEEYAPLFADKMLLPATPAAEIRPATRQALVFRFLIEQEHSHQVFDIGFFDVSSEDMRQAQASAAMKHYIKHADGMIFLLDPLLIAGSTLPGAASYRTRHANSPQLHPENAVTYLRQLFEAEHLATRIEPLKIPIAFTLTKLDLLLSQLDPSSLLSRHLTYHGDVDQMLLQSVSTEVAALLAAWINPLFCQTLDKEIPRHAYFAVSALGEKPSDNTRKVASISPLHIEDPLLWLLDQLNVIKKGTRR